MEILEEWPKSLVVTQRPMAVRTSSGSLSKSVYLQGSCKETFVTSLSLWAPILSDVEGEPLRKEVNLWLEIWVPILRGNGRCLGKEREEVSRGRELRPWEANLPQQRVDSFTWGAVHGSLMLALKASGTSALDLDAPGKWRPTLEASRSRHPPAQSLQIPVKKWEVFWICRAPRARTPED